MAGMAFRRMVTRTSTREHGLWVGKQPASQSGSWLLRTTCQTWRWALSSLTPRSFALSDQPPAEPVFKAPLVAVLLAVSLPILFWLQTTLPDGGLSLAFRPALLWRGEEWPGLFTSMFIHGGWTHVAMNAIVAFAFGPPVARLMPGPGGAAGFLGFYIVTGLAGALGYALVHPDSFDAVGGASAAML